MDIELLRIFVEVSRCGSVTSAARALGVSQPTLSRQIRRLEAELGVHLLDRSATGVVLTPAGRKVLTGARSFRILLLAPAVFCVSIMLSARRDKALPTQVAMPRFVIGFMLAVALASLQPLPASAIRLASEASGACLVLAIAAVGLKTRLGELCSLGFKPLLMLLLETCFLLGFVLVGVLVLRGG